MSLRAATVVLSAGLPAVAPLAPPLPVSAVPALPASAPLIDARSHPPSVPGHTLGITQPAAPAASALPGARAQLQAAQPPSKPGSAASERAFYERVFSGAKEGEEPPAVELRSDGPSDPTLPALKADVEKLLTHLSRTPTSWRSGPQIGAALVARVEAVQAARGIPRRVPKGWFGSEVVVDPLDKDLLAQLPGLADAIRRVARSERQDYSDLLYSFNVLTGRVVSREQFARDIAWLYGTYRLGGQ